MGENYAAFRDFRVDPKGIGLHEMTIPPGEVIRLTEAEVVSHPEYRGFRPLARHPPMRGWLATSVGGDGRVYGLLHLSDKSGGREFDESDEPNIHELAALIGETLDALRLAAHLAGVVGGACLQCTTVRRSSRAVCRQALPAVLRPPRRRRQLMPQRRSRTRRCAPLRDWPQVPPALPVAPARLRRTGRGAVLHD